MEGRTGCSGEEGPETEQEDAQVDGANQLGSGVYQQPGGTGRETGQEDPGLGGGGLGCLLIEYLS